MARTLDVYLHEALAGQLMQDDGGQMSFHYTRDWLARPDAVPLSQSLPLRPKRFTGKECHGFFGGILPDEGKRAIIARNLGISARNDYAMLEQIGGECAGAVTFLQAGEKLPTLNPRYEKLSAKALAAILEELPRRPLLAGDRGIRLSLAGAQDKLAVALIGGEVCLPLDGAPSSHILKPAVERFPGIVSNEALCMHLAAAAGLPTARTTTDAVNGKEYLLVERYDRRRGGEPNTAGFERLHQEDFCQALGIASETKYQKEGGPSLPQCFTLLRQVSSVPARDLGHLLDAVVYNYLAGNCDAHGKNFSLLYGRGGPSSGETSLAPLYDVLSTAAYPDLSLDMAMKLGGEYSSARIGLRNFERLAEEAGLAKPLVRRRVRELAAAVLVALPPVEAVYPQAHAIAARIRERCLGLSSTRPT
ncbi:MAG TPA: type II toxin-antitoxin system HipA family toxin [Terriglobales bacterium]|nr:type II toxin-antitoxin system HipA family toxin [Terriglobales bacterium]